MITITILLSIIIGMSFIIGSLISKIIGYKKLTYFSLSITFITILSSLILNIIPNIFKLSTKYSDLRIFIFIIILSVIAFIAINAIIPNNSYRYSSNKKDKDKYLNHVNALGMISVIIFNILCGIILYYKTSSYLSSGINYAARLCLFNIPFGISISTMLRKTNNNFSYKYFIVLFSSFIGVIIGYISPYISNNVFLILFSFICGFNLITSILLYGVEVIKNYKYDGIKEGILIGLILFAYILL